jgi:hypothetical protein
MRSGTIVSRGRFRHQTAFEGTGEAIGLDMRWEPAYNPLDKRNLEVSVANALLARIPNPVPPGAMFLGPGLYALYYTGDFPAYRSVSLKSKPRRETPIYVGKAVPSGARKNAFGRYIAPERVLYDHLVEHANSISKTKDLEVADFLCRYLVVDDMWIPYVESLLIERFSPVWNCLIKGFGDRDPGKGRYQGQMQSWDVLHPGRDWAAKLQPHKRQAEDLLVAISEFFERQPRR